jgi:hypothetical protein
MTIRKMRIGHEKKNKFNLFKQKAQAVLNGRENVPSRPLNITENGFADLNFSHKAENYQG